jgi:hypothetical protein
MFPYRMSQFVNLTTKTRPSKYLPNGPSTPYPGGGGEAATDAVSVFIEVLSKDMAPFFILDFMV